MKNIRVKFIDWWNGHVPEENVYYKILSRHFRVELCDNPDYVIDGGLGREYLKYENAIKIVSVGENFVPDFNFFDYAVGFDRLDFGDRYLRVPLYAFYGEYSALKNRVPPSPEELLNRGFCSYVVTNSGRADPLRTAFFKELSKYKPVASGGRYMNNVGGPVADKAAFCRGYKFNIAFENCASPGYVTEKVMQPLSWFSVPVYFGAPDIEKDFTPECMVRVRDAADVERAIDEIVALDRDDEAYLKRVSAPCLVEPHGRHMERLEEFLVKIFNQPLSSARRLNIYGYQPVLRGRVHRLSRIEDLARIPLRAFKKAIGRR